jgi:hypothetical protein
MNGPARRPLPTLLALGAAMVACGTTPLDVVDRSPQTDGGSTNPLPDAMLADHFSTARDGLVAHWSFDEGAGLIAHDDSGNGYHAHLVGGYWTLGRFGGGLAFLPGDYVAVDGFQDATAAWTVSAWARFGTSAAHGSWGSIVSTELLGQGGWIVYLEGDAPFLLPRLNFEFARPNSTYDGVGCCSDLAADVWYHVTAVADASLGVLILYHGTREATRIVLASAPTPGDPTLYMGKWRAVDNDRSLGGWLNGIIDDVTIFSRALSPTEVADLDAAPIPSP